MKFMHVHLALYVFKAPMRQIYQVSCYVQMKQVMKDKGFQLDVYESLRKLQSIYEAFFYERLKMVKGQL